MKKTLALIALAASTVAVAAPAPKGPLLIQTESRIEVDAQGQVTAITTTPALPAEIEAVVHGNLRKLRFAPPMKDGHAVPGVTFALQDACAAPDIGGTWRFVTQMRGNGPSLDQRVFPAYPRQAERAGSESTWKVTYAIAPDGSASLVDATREDAKDRFNDEYRAVLTKWIQTMHFRPEQLDGQPVATKMEHRVVFTLSTRRPHRDATAAANDSCIAALKAQDDDERDIALDSPFKPLPAN